MMPTMTARPTCPLCGSDQVHSTYDTDHCQSGGRCWSCGYEFLTAGGSLEATIVCRTAEATHLAQLGPCERSDSDGFTYYRYHRADEVAFTEATRRLARAGLCPFYGVWVFRRRPIPCAAVFAADGQGGWQDVETIDPHAGTCPVVRVRHHGRPSQADLRKAREYHRCLRVLLEEEAQAVTGGQE